MLRAIGAPLLIACALSGCNDSAGPTESTSGSHGDLTDQEYNFAVALARQEVRQDSASLSSATVTVGRGPETESNLGYPCQSNRLLYIKLIGAFPHMKTTGQPLDQNSNIEPPHNTVHAVTLTADAQSGRACLQGVQTGNPTPAPESVPLQLN
ncbi:MAG: hypothetical protein LH645_00635 [Actinomycetia bacterium]|nr:hypothetical protein [Actinomycetes bacterium]